MTNTGQWVKVKMWRKGTSASTTYTLSPTTREAVTVQTGNGGVLQQSMSLGPLLVVENCTFRGQEISIQKLVK